MAPPSNVHKDKGKEMAARHISEINEAITQRGGGDSNQAVLFMVGYVSENHARQAELGVPSASTPT
jgi:hypothetical protein